jgi:hypothetical protein
VDIAPAGGLIEDAARVAADWIVVPTKPDKSLLGLQRVSHRLAALRDDGLPVGVLTGVVLFAIPAAAIRIRHEARRELVNAFGDQNVVFDTVIRASERGAIDQARNGLVAVEYAHAAGRLAKPYWQDREAPRFAAGAHPCRRLPGPSRRDPRTRQRAHEATGVSELGGLSMARLTESELAGFRTGTNPPSDDDAPRPRRRSKNPPREPTAQQPRADQPALALHTDRQNIASPLGPVPPAPARGEARHKVGLTLPLKLAEEVRALTQQGFAPADLVMVAYEHHRDELVEARQARTVRQLQRRTVGRSAFTVTLSPAERDALDALARHLDTTRSQTVAALLQRHLIATEASKDPATAAAPPPTPRSVP